MTETVAEQAGAEAAEGRSRVIITAYIAVLISLMALDVAGLTGNWQEPYTLFLVITVAAFSVIALGYLSVRARSGLASEPVRLWFARRGAFLGFVSALLIGITGAPDFAGWWEGITGHWGSWLVLAVSTAIAAKSTWDMLAGDSTEVKTLRLRVEVSRRQARGLLNSNKALVKQARTDSSLRTKNKHLLEENKALKKQLEGLQQAAEEQGITLPWPPAQQAAPEEAHRPSRRGQS